MGDPEWLDENNQIKNETENWELDIVIPDFLKLSKERNRKQAIFRIDEEIEGFLYRFKIMFYATGCNLENNGYVSTLFIEDEKSHLNSDTVSYTFSCIISVIDNSGESRFTQSFSFSRDAENKRNPYTPFGLERFVSCSTLLNNTEEFLSKGCLTIHCSIVNLESYHINSMHGRNIYLAMSCNESIIVEQMSDETTKYKIPFGTPIFYYLHSQSKYFRRIIETPMREAADQFLYICNDEYNAFCNLATFLSCGSLRQIEDISDLFELYAVADKYEILHLQQLCADLLIKDTTFENALDILLLADMHGDQNLKAETIHFIKSFITEVIHTDSWIQLTKECKNLAEEILKNINVSDHLDVLSQTEDEDKFCYKIQEYEMASCYFS